MKKQYGSDDESTGGSLRVFFNETSFDGISTGMKLKEEIVSKLKTLKQLLQNVFKTRINLDICEVFTRMCRAGLCWRFD